MDLVNPPNSLVSAKVDIGSFEDNFLNKSYFLGENKLDHVLLSLLHLIDAKSIDGRKACRVFDYQGFTYLVNVRNLITKISKNANSSIRFRYRKESTDKNFNPVEFCLRYKIPMDRASGLLPLKFKNCRVVFHSLKLSYAIYLTLKMFRLGDIRTRQRFRQGRVFLSSHNLLTVIFLKIFKSLLDLGLSSEKELIKCIKNSLCLLVSNALNQDELPETPHISLFPDEVSRAIKKLDLKSRARLCFSCLQSKVLCQEVSEDFILETLIKHQSQLSSPHPGISEEALSFLKEKGKEFGKKVSKYYRPKSGSFPTNRATFEFPRMMGGVKGDLVFHNRLKDHPKDDPDDRMEPFVIGLFGQPGQGKSLALNELIFEMSRAFPGVSPEDLTYQRTCHVEHWDGYKNQPIVILDDLGQSTEGKDIREFQTLVSCCPYVLPMAHLDEKGRKFSSPVIICTSNLMYGSRLRYVYEKNNPVIDENSFWRRFHFPIYVEKLKYYALNFQPEWVNVDSLYFKKLSPQMHDRFSDQNHFRLLPNKEVKGPQHWKRLVEFSGLVDVYQERCVFHDNYRQYWTQTVVDRIENTNFIEPLLQEIRLQDTKQIFEHAIETTCSYIPSYRVGTGVTKSISFPAFPPPGPLPVRVEPIVEPLKVRTITAGIGDTFCLKPFQRAMWKALGDYPQFILTHGTQNLVPAIKRIHNQDLKDPVYISGDYSGATDSFAIEASKALLDGILESVTHEPTKRWALKEISPHLLVYPKKSGLEPSIQKSGQLMGSLLSFPLLCLLNDCIARRSGLLPHQYLINGDDILIRCESSVFPLWKEQVRSFGLELSQGKNYVHKEIGTINSQLIFNDEVTGTGKQLLLDRRTRVLGDCLRELELAMPDIPTKEVIDLFKSVNRKKLSLTVRNINVPVSHGGLSFSWGHELDDRSHRTAILCYLHDLFKKIKPQKGCLAIPYFSSEKRQEVFAREEELIFNEPVGLKEFHEDFLSSVDLSSVRERLLGNPHMRDIFLAQPLRSLPSLSFLTALQIPFTDIKIKKDLQLSIDQSFFKNFLQGGLDFSYERFRENFLLTTMGLPTNCKVSSKHVVNFMDLNLRPDYLKMINLNFSPSSFDRSLFEENIGRALEPKNFDLPTDIPDFEDFSKEIIDCFIHNLGNDMGKNFIPISETEQLTDSTVSM